MCDFDTTDLVRFAPAALRQASKKGSLTEVKKQQPRYYCLSGNLLYSFERDNDAASLCGIMFLESSVLKIVGAGDGVRALSVSTVGGKTVLLSGPIEELSEWLEAIEAAKFKSISRQLEDAEAVTMQLHHQVEEQELARQEAERGAAALQEQLWAIEEQRAELENTVQALNNRTREISSQLKGVERERQLLLKSRGITPKVLPLWAQQPRDGVGASREQVRIWTGTWNLGSSEPFAGMEKARAQRLLQPLVPSGYDIYVLGVQDCVSDSVFDCLTGLLEAEGCRRLRLDCSILSDMLGDHGQGGSVDLGKPSTYEPSPGNRSHQSAAPSPSCSGVSNGGTVTPGDFSKLVGRGEGSLLSVKFTGIAVFVKHDLLTDVRLLAVTNIPISPSQSRGGVAAALSVMGRTVVFVCCQFFAKHAENLRQEDQYRDLLMGLGSQLAEPGFHLLEQFHHILWCGDFSYGLVDISGNPMPPDTVCEMLQDGRLVRTLFDTHDQLNQEKRKKNILFGFREAVPFPNFYPTYKKIENRNPVDYSRSSWVANSYRTYRKASFYKGGKVREFTPAFTDRIFYVSGGFP
ncbi:hypothetical protein B484DRAFT_251482 [Ochromonadaceae sp. CCMP2298]|nr:hypothetical protein B484DRAFT_251482 [Ochromonadaceae sp. CCMP2298]|mmetsp:Transcript_11841/g.26303  ORF Transcript_11841/g.26303 Transcript_11841/m.26303 type:complete len:576 (+) Transcript_11841:158-1885(+)